MHHELGSSSGRELFAQYFRRCVSSVEVDCSCGRPKIQTRTVISAVLPMRAFSPSAWRGKRCDQLLQFREIASPFCRPPFLALKSHVDSVVTLLLYCVIDFDTVAETFAATRLRP